MYTLGRMRPCYLGRGDRRGPGSPSRVLASRSELSVQNLQRILDALHAALVIQPEEALAERVSPKRGARALAAAAGL